MNVEMYDTIILGSGSAGLSAAVYAKRAQMNFIVIEKIHLGIGQIALSERVDNYLGLYGLTGYELGVKFREHAKQFGTAFVEGTAKQIIPQDAGYTIVLSDNRTYAAKTIIYAAGANPRKLEIPGETELTGSGVSYCAICDGAFYRGGVTAVVGGGDTALGDALFLSKICSKVYLIHRRSEFRANSVLKERVLAAENIETVLNTVPVEIKGESVVTSVRVKTGDEYRELPIDGIFIAVGSKPNTDILKGITELDKNGYIIADESGITAAKGIFAAGDVRTKPLRQVVTAVSDGANCVYSLEKYLSI